jgi:hypothetical protein
MKHGVRSRPYIYSTREADRITSSEALSLVDSDWAVDNIHRYPENLVYVEHIKQIGNTPWPQFKAAFEAGK